MSQQLWLIVCSKREAEREEEVQPGDDGQSKEDAHYLILYCMYEE